MDAPKGKNRRSSQRREVGFTLVFGVKKPYGLRVSLGLNDDLDALMLDLSDSGMAITSGFNLPKGTLLHMKFNFINLYLSGQERSRRVEIDGEVVSSVELSDGNYRLGVCFNRIADEDREAIRYFIKRSN